MCMWDGEGRAEGEVYDGGGMRWRSIPKSDLLLHSGGGGEREEEESTIETCEKVLWEFHRESSGRLINSGRFV